MELEDLKNIVVLIALIALIAGAAAIAMIGFRDNVEADISGTVSTSIQATLPSTVGTAVTLTAGDLGIISVEDVRNEYQNSSGSYLNRTPVIDVDFNITSGQIIWTNSSDLGNESYWNYTSKSKNVAYNITTAGMTGVDNSTSFLGVTGTIVGVSVLLGLVGLAFYFGRK